MQFNSLLQLLDYFKEESTCVEYYEQIRFGDGLACPHCGCTIVGRTQRGFRCSTKGCGKKFTVRTGTIFEQSNIKLKIWFAAIWLATEHKKGGIYIQCGRVFKNIFNLLILRFIKVYKRQQTYTNESNYFPTE